jgi:hypothetical protein
VRFSDGFSTASRRVLDGFSTEYYIVSTVLDELLSCEVH